MTRLQMVLALRALRAAYDKLTPGDRAVLRRCRDGEDIRLEGAFWHLADEVPEDLHRAALAEIVSIFPSAEQRSGGGRWSLGEHLATILDPKRLARPDNTLRFRQLVRCRNRTAACRRLGGVLQRGGPVDWGELGADIVVFGDGIRRKWAQDFFSRRSRYEE